MKIISHNFKKHFFSILSIFVIILSITSCIKKPSDNNEDKDENIVNAEDLAFESFAITVKENPNIYGDVVFTNESPDRLAAEIKHYKTDLNGLIVSFISNASKITVNGEEQINGETANDFSEAITYTLYNGRGETKNFTVSLTNKSYTGEPVLVISTEGGEPITSREEWLKGTISIDKQNEDADYENFKGEIEIKGRGHNTWTKEKKPYGFKLASGATIMGMKKGKRWVLLANASDKTLLRNRVAFEIGKCTSLAWTPDSRYIDVVLNGEFLGSYLLCEQIRVDENRVNITPVSDKETSADAITGGYLFEIDRYWDEDPKIKTKIASMPVMFKNDVNTVQISYATEYLNKIEDILYNGDVNSDAYRDFIDIDSFIDWWIIHELTVNTEPNLPGSCYMHKDKGGKMVAGPIWDFDLTTFKESSSFKIKDALWYSQLFKHEDFKQRVKGRWNTLKPKFETIPVFIDNEAQKLEVAANRNWSQWTLTAGQNQDELLSWDEAVAKMRKNYIDRMNWLDREINAL